MRVLVLASSLFLAAVAAGSAFAQPPAAPATTTAPANAAQRSPAAAAAEQVVNAFMADLANGQLDAARQLMTPDAVVIANGRVLGDRDGYIDGPAKADVAALRATTQRELVHRNVQAGAGLGWVVSEKHVRATVPGAQAPRDIVVTETMLLTQAVGGSWKITHIHWSSRQAG